ncbi:protein TRIGALACTOSYLDIACYLGLYCEROL 4, chloroplastic [Cucurbita pepo subsp. pepo]|uniref:protein TRIGALACTOSYLDIACYLGLYCEROL 4, chloroplastic n=1 Tax=Cucurbita pepo subsp. pepo TaxID=3664 RepID=UPI000C9D5480|nr:protein TRIGALACTOSYLDIACYLGLYCEROL 4, chloroplastic [Cucurbita pepo subsp. pepo]
MAHLRTAMDSAFWDFDVSSSQTLVGTAKAVPGEPFPLDGARASRTLRIQQVSFLGNGFPLGILPSFSPTAHKELGSFSLQSLLLKFPAADWWVGLVGQFRPKKVISSIKEDLVSDLDNLELLPALKDVATMFLDKTLYSYGLCSQFSPTPFSSVFASTEEHGDRKGRRHKAMFYHRLPHHDINLEAAWPELFIDHKGQYWEVPESLSLDLSSLKSESGLRYRVGLHKNGGVPRALYNTDGGDPPLTLMPGLCAKAAFSLEKNRYLWGGKEQKQGVTETIDDAEPSYDVRLKDPHAAISGIVGGTFSAWFGGSDTVGTNGDGNLAIHNKRSPLNADLFGSLCCTYQHGSFRKDFRDLTRLDARLDISSGSAFSKRVFNGFKKSIDDLERSKSTPRLNLIFQQQIAGPIVFRVDSRLMLDSTSVKRGPHVEDTILSLNYSFKLLESGKAVFWFSPKRKEGMVELRLFEF